MTVSSSDPDYYKLETPDDILWFVYHENKHKYVEYDKNLKLIPKKEISEYKKWEKSLNKNFTLETVRSRLLPLCIIYGITHQSLWQAIRGWSKYE